MYKLFSGSYWQAVAKLRESTKLAPSGLLSLDTPIAARCVANLRPAPQAAAPGQVHRPFSQKDQGVFQSATVQCPRGGSLPRTASVIVTAPWDPRTQASLAPRPR